MDKASLSRLFSKQLSKLRLSPIRKVAAMLDEAASKQDIISFGGGAPSLLPPKELIETFIEDLESNPADYFKYTSTRGALAFREKIAQDVKEYSGVDYDPAKEIIVTEGSTEGIFLVLASLLEEGDEIILTDPTYLGYSEIISMFKAKEVRIKQLKEHGYQPSLEELEEKINSKTKAILINTPENPTGRILSSDVARGIVEIAKDKGIFVIVDEAYKHIVYEKENTYLQKIDKENVISVCSFSKEASSPGFRLGYVCANEEVITNLEKIKQFVTLCSNMVGQKVLMNYLASEIKRRYLKEVVIPTYRARRDFMLKMIRKYLPDSNVSTPEGGFYVFLDLRPWLGNKFENDEDVMFDLFKRKKLVIIPGSYFGKMGKGSFRLTFVSEDLDRIEEGIRRLVDYLETDAV
ncbi:MAG TPA: pyridoxal phosphate-dependent aminotransferase [Geobacterales bacterium]|nr:pyridoxal phosphate-dependent aminotransferase [Geobacterales bacterium]